ncbi:MAG: DUF1127 domain-containing protein [Silicimonas sp.]|nr:DUF1127 domain-containing protein [Silicimonas sp.]
MTTKTITTASRFPQARATRRGIVGTIFKAMAIRRERKKLSRLDAALLRDIGKNRQDAITEASRAVWDAPNRWFL